jgi:hypothetical protein
MTIHVTQDHIDRGIRKSPFDCPITLAVNEQTGLRVSTTHAWFRVIDKEGNTIKYIDFNIKSIADFISKFDWELPVEPFSFEIEL